jgi:hypothetical protein
MKESLTLYKNLIYEQAFNIYQRQKKSYKNKNIKINIYERLLY